MSCLWWVPHWTRFTESATIYCVLFMIHSDEGKAACNSWNGWQNWVGSHYVMLWCFGHLFVWILSGCEIKFKVSTHKSIFFRHCRWSHWSLANVMVKNPRQILSLIVMVLMTHVVWASIWITWSQACQSKYFTFYFILFFRRSHQKFSLRTSKIAKYEWPLRRIFGFYFAKTATVDQTYFS